MTIIPLGETAAAEKRRRGAQPGNANRRKHGYYAADMRAQRTACRRLVPIMKAGLQAFAESQAALDAWKRSRAPTRKKREIEHQFALAFFETCQILLKTAVEAGFDRFEPDAPRTGSNPSGMAEGASNAGI